MGTKRESRRSVNPILTNMLVTFLDMTPSCDVRDKQHMNIYTKEKIFSPNATSRSLILFISGAEEKIVTLLNSIYFMEQIINFMLLILTKKPSKETQLSLGSKFTALTLHWSESLDQ